MSYAKRRVKLSYKLKKKRFRNAANAAIIVESFFVLTKSVNASTFNNTNFKNSFEKNIEDVDQTKIIVISRKVKSLKFEKLKSYKSLSKRKHNR